MDMLKRLNLAIAYIEENLCDKIDFDEVVKIACVSKDSFMRFFSYMTGMTLHEYIRRRKLTLAAYELQNGKEKIIDIAIKYGWDSADAFTKAFVKQHNITPTMARKRDEALKIYPPASFYIMIKGAKEMDFRIIELEETEVYGVSKQFIGQGYKTREELRHEMWADDCDNVPGRICTGHWNEHNNHSFDGVWYGIWQDGKYMIAREKADTNNNALEKIIISSGTYAAFKTDCGGLAWEEFPKLRELIFESWLPNSEYRQKEDIAIEVLHLWTDRDIRNKNRYYEVWIPVVKK
ncbi:helix-turn-helix domain-containing protein [Paludicola sp. MB14-C6]|uniref:AraC family transcriptional regulator n=1 Tax=Paludihabitans sp. MB14-C6 TaxID=3070656 RepID=UPI0027DD7256|nr:helix-turn-helix domain-containing protein [Paludicola sp. MB14-C6]WMJ23190.1 helix-turn-helix domain-containing protein [Paludicola sp. MB14-C6]